MTESEGNNNTSDEPPSEEANSAEVDIYLSITDEKIALFTASASSASGSRGHVKSEQLRKILLDSTGEADRFRKSLLVRMNNETLLALFDRLFDPDEYPEYCLPSGRNDLLARIKNDPIRRPVFDIVIEKQLLPDPEGITDRKFTDAFSDREAPDFPCTLETAILWMAEAPKALYLLLYRAFTDWHIVTPKRDTTTSKAAISKLKKQIKSLQITSPAQADEARSQLKSRKEWVSLARRAESYSFSFTAGESRPAKNLNEAIQKLLRDRLRTPPMVEDKKHLLHFVDFSHFWRMHAEAYKAAAKHKSNINSSAGLEGPIARMYETWLSRTDEFIAFSRRSPLPLTGSDEWNQLLNDFSETQKGVKRTRKKIASFMGIHLAAHLNGKLVDSLATDLKTADIKAFDQHTIDDVMKKLQSAL